MLDFRYKTKIKDIQDKYKFKIFCYDATGITIEEFNENATEKTQEFNENAVEKTNDFNENAVLLYNAFPKVTGEGTDLTLNNTVKCPLVLDLKGNTYQDSTTPMDIHNVSGDNTIEICGKNTFDKATITTGKLINKNTGAEDNDASTDCSDYIDVSQFEKVILSGATVSYSNGGAFYDNSKTYISGFSSSALKNGLTIVNGAKYLRFNLLPVDLDTAQLESGSTATEYEAYQGQNYPINLPNGIELCKIGNYQDYIYKDSDKWYLHKEIGKVVLDGSETWALETNGCFGLRSSNLFSDRMLFNSSQEGLLSNYYKVALSGDYYIRWRGSNEYNVNIKNKDISVADDFKTWLSTHNTIVYYVLATPTNTEITDTTLLEQLNNLEQAKSYDEQTNISQTNNDMPFVIKASAIYDLSNLIPTE